MPKFQLILDCKEEHANQIINYVKKEISNDFIVVTDDTFLKERLASHGIRAKTVLEYIPNSREEDHRIFQLVEDEMKLLRQDLSHIKDDDVSIFYGIQHIMNDDLIMLEKFNTILRSSKGDSDVIICLSAYTYYHFAIVNLASWLGYTSNLPLIIKDNVFSFIDPLSITSHNYIYDTIYHGKPVTDKKVYDYKMITERIFEFQKRALHIFTNEFKNSLQIKATKTDTGIHLSIKISKFNMSEFRNLLREIKNKEKAMINDPRLYLKNDTNRTESKLKNYLAKLKFNKQPSIFFLHTNDIDLYLKPVYPVIEQFHKNQYPYFIIAHDTRAQKALSDKIIDFFDYQSYLHDFGYNIESIRKMIIAIKTIASKNNSVVSIYFQYFLNDSVFFRLVENSRLVRLLSFLVSTLDPISVFIMPDGIGEHLLLCEIAKKNQVKSVTTFANLISPSARSVGFMGADIIASYGEDCNESLTKLGYDENRLVMAGNPRYDEMQQQEIEFVKTNLLKKMVINFNRPIIFIATSGHDHHEADWISKLITYANRNDYEIIIKFHPSYEAERSRDLLSKTNSQKFHLVQSDIEISQLLPVSTIVITDNSSVGVGGILLDKPLIVANLIGQPYDNNRYDEYGVALLGTTIEELESCIDNILNDKQICNKLKAAREKYQYWYNYKNDGMAAKRIFDILTSKDSKIVPQAAQVSKEIA
jgi:hypothetical protein